MSRAPVLINGQRYTIGCAPGEEARIAALAAAFEATLNALKDKIGDVGERTLAVMAGLSALDRLEQAEAANAKLKETIAVLERAREAALLAADTDDEKVVARIEAAATALDRLASGLNRDTRIVSDALAKEGAVRPVAIAPTPSEPAAATVLAPSLTMAAAAPGAEPPPDAGPDANLPAPERPRTAPGPAHAPIDHKARGAPGPSAAAPSPAVVATPNG